VQEESAVAARAAYISLNPELFLFDSHCVGRSATSNADCPRLVPFHSRLQVESGCTGGQAARVSSGNRDRGVDFRVLGPKPGRPQGPDLYIIKRIIRRTPFVVRDRVPIGLRIGLLLQSSCDPSLSTPTTRPGIECRIFPPSASAQLKDSCEHRLCHAGCQSLRHISMTYNTYIFSSPRTHR